MNDTTAKADPVRALIDVATGAIPHLYRGTCPDQLNGPDCRDGECAACAAIDAALAQQAVAVGGECSFNCMATMSCDNSCAPQPAIPEDVARDAARYRWLRSDEVGMSSLWTLFHKISDDCNPPYRELKHGAELDAAIDAQHNREGA